MSDTAIPIDISEVPQSKRNDPDFINLHAQIGQVLRMPKWLHAFSIHETGHWIYLQRVGVTNFRFNGPTIIYDPNTNQFVGYPASVQPLIGSVNPDNFDFAKWIFDVMKGFAAGGVFSRELTAAPDSGDEEDRQNFEAILNSICDKVPGIALDRDALWKDAQDAVKQELRSPAFRKEAWEKAAELREKIFGQ
ncbi:MAG: hypothetical protein WCC18_18595 [Candidatus Acidiferrales bacterium]